MEILEIFYYCQPTSGGFWVVWCALNFGFWIKIANCAIAVFYQCGIINRHLVCLELAIFRIVDYQKHWNMLFLVHKSPKSPMKPPKSPKIPTWQVQNLSNIPKFQISSFQNLRLSKKLKYAILCPKIAKIALEIVRNRPKSPPDGFEICQIFSNSKLAVFWILDCQKRWNMPFLVQKSPKSPPGGYTVNNYVIWVEIMHFFISYNIKSFKNH